MKVPEHLKKFHKQKMIFICYSRLKVIIPLILLFCIYFVIRDIILNSGSGGVGFQVIFDFVTLGAAAVLAVVYLLTKPGSMSDVADIHSVFQKLTGFIIILWGALVTVLFPDRALGYATLGICLFITCGLMLIEIPYLVIFSVTGLLMLHLDISPVPAASDQVMLMNDMIVLLAGFIIAIIINSLNRNSLTEAFLLEAELEEKVADRTRKLEEETRKAQLSDNMKTVFLANMSHEIRTPLNGILGFSNLLRDEKLKPGTRQQYIEIVIKSGNTLLEILNEIIEVSRIESGAVELFLEEFCLNDIIRDVVEGFKVHDKVQSGSISIINESEGYEPVIMISDRLKIIQILINLINNAAKYTDSGYVSCGIETSSQLVRVFVKDTGRGIATEEQDLIFERFRQVEKSPYSGKDGVGLGLTIVKGYVDMLKGEISLDSTPGKGTMFRVEIPINFHEA